MQRNTGNSQQMAMACSGPMAKWRNTGKRSDWKQFQLLHVIISAWWDARRLSIRQKRLLQLILTDNWTETGISLKLNIYSFQ